MKKRTFLAASVAALACLNPTQTWAAKPLLADTLKPISVEQKSWVLGTNSLTRLEIEASRATDLGRTVSVLRYTVSMAQTLQGFDMAFFEGPGAPVQHYKPMRVTIKGAGKTYVHKLGVAGYRGGVLDDGFVFEAVGDSSGKADAITTVLQQIEMGAQSIEISVANGKKRSSFLATTFTLKPQ